MVNGMAEHPPDLIYEARRVRCVPDGARRIRWLFIRPAEQDFESEIDLQVRAGEQVAIVGAPGSGKTLLAETLTLRQRPGSGEVWFEGQQITRWSDRKLRAVRPRLQYVFSDPRRALSPKAGVREVVEEARGLVKGGGLTAVAALELAGLNGAVADRALADLSVVQRQRVALARALAAKPVMLVWDTPVALFNRGGQAAFFETLRSAQHQIGVAVVWTTEDATLAAQFADRALRLAGGRLQAI